MKDLIKDTALALCQNAPNLRGYPPNSLGGRAIQRGWDAYLAGEPCPDQWPYLAASGWYQAKEAHENNDHTS